MRILCLLAGVAALGLVSGDLALAQGRGGGNDREQAQGKGGGDKDARGGPGAGRGNGGGEERRGQERRGQAEPQAQRDRPDRPSQAARGPERRPDRAPDRARAERDDRGPDRREAVIVDNSRRPDRRDEDRRVDARSGPIFRAVSDRGLIAGCPPGLAKKNNGCLPPGQAKKVYAPSRYDRLWNRWNDDYDYRYDNGYVYRISPQGDLWGYQPVLGGALGLGQPWPAQYAYDPVPDYYARYFGLPDRYQYRYADGALFGLDPQTQAISQVAALLTGQPWTVGQPMPAGYDVYNVPYAYRPQYLDTPQSLYRYSDGYVYQVDPTTRLVQAAIQLLT